MNKGIIIYEVFVIFLFGTRFEMSNCPPPGYWSSNKVVKISVL